MGRKVTQERPILNHMELLFRSLQCSVLGSEKHFADLIIVRAETPIADNTWNEFTHALMQNLHPHLSDELCCRTHSLLGIRISFTSHLPNYTKCSRTAYGIFISRRFQSNFGIIFLNSATQPSLLKPERRPAQLRLTVSLQAWRRRFYGMPSWRSWARAFSALFPGSRILFIVVVVVVVVVVFVIVVDRVVRVIAFLHGRLNAQKCFPWLS